jgi:RNA polymerase sigma-70 factor (ECF subfamily)
MTKHLSLDRLKAKNFQWSPIPEQMSQRAAADNPEVATDGTQFMEMLEMALKELPPIQRKLFEYREIEGLTYEEMGRREDLSLSSVKVYLHRARTTLRTALINASNGDYNYE